MPDMITYIRPSGTTIDLADTPNLRAFAEQRGWVPEGDKFNIETASKDELEAFAQEHFNVDLDKRKGEDKLRAELTDLINGNG
jgi:hypothetical protein